jgi:hypothetical protein
MREPCESLRFAEQTRALRRVVVRVQSLHGDLAIELGVVGDVDGAHRAFSEQIAQLEPTEAPGRGASVLLGDDAGRERRHHVPTGLAPVEVQIRRGQWVAIEATLEEREQDLVVGTRHVGLVLS